MKTRPIVSVLAALWLAGCGLGTPGPSTRTSSLNGAQGAQTGAAACGSQMTAFKQCTLQGTQSCDALLEQLTECSLLSANAPGPATTAGCNPKTDPKCVPPPPPCDPKTDPKCILPPATTGDPKTGPDCGGGSKPCQPLEDLFKQCLLTVNDASCDTTLDSLVKCEAGILGAPH